MTKTERFIYIERVRRENTEATIKAMESAARFQKQENRINNALTMLRVWSVYNLALMWGYRSES